MPDIDPTLNNTTTVQPHPTKGAVDESSIRLDAEIREGKN
jgi:hypothetical protein